MPKPFDRHLLDCADWFMAALLHDYPDLHFEERATEHGRPVWLITIPAQPTYAAKEVDAKAFDLQTRLLFGRGVLIGYVLQRDDDL